MFVPNHGSARQGKRHRYRRLPFLPPVSGKQGNDSHCQNQGCKITGIPNRERKIHELNSLTWLTITIGSRIINFLLVITVSGDLTSTPPIGTIRDGMNTDNTWGFQAGLVALTLVVWSSLLLTGCSPSSSKNPIQATTIEEAMESPERVEELDLYYRRLESFPPEILHLINLKHLTLRTCTIGRLPPEIANLSKLTSLDLGEASLTNLTPSVGTLTNLTRLWLNDNALTSLPGELGRLSRLEYLNLDRNQLATLPEEVGTLQSLTWLRLNQNKLYALPQDLSGLAQNLKTLYLLGNPIPKEEQDRIKKMLPACTIYFEGVK